MATKCPKCGEEIYTDPNSCVLCGWKRGDRVGPHDRPHDRGYEGYPPREPNRYEGYDQRPSRPPNRQERYGRREQQDYRDRKQRYGPQESSYPPSSREGPARDISQDNFCPNCKSQLFTDPNSCVLCGWKKSDERREREPPDRYTRPRGRARPMAPPPKQRPRREWPSWNKNLTYVCDNCGNPTLQFFTDGFGRCPACSHRFRFSSRPSGRRAKQRHDQYMCSKCNNKNLQFYKDGFGRCPRCDHRFRWLK